MEGMIHMELYIEALERLVKDNGRSYSQEEVMQEFGITREQLDSCDVEIEWLEAHERKKAVRAKALAAFEVS